MAPISPGIFWEMVESRTQPIRGLLLLATVFAGLLLLALTRPLPDYVGILGTTLAIVSLVLQIREMLADWLKRYV